MYRRFQVLTVCLNPVQGDGKPGQKVLQDQISQMVSGGFAPI